MQDLLAPSGSGAYCEPINALIILRKNDFQLGKIGMALLFCLMPADGNSN